MMKSLYLLAGVSCLLLALPVYSRQQTFMQFCQASAREASVHLLKSHVKKSSCHDLAAFFTSTSHVRLASMGLRDLEFLRFFDHITHLDLSDNHLQELKPLAALSRLRYLWLGENAIADVSALQALGKLELLDLHANSLRDIRPLKACRRLKALDLSYNLVEDPEALAGLSDLRYLFLSYNHIRDLSAFALAQPRRGQTSYWSQQLAHLWAQGDAFYVMTIDHNPISLPLWAGGLRRTAANCPQESSFPAITKLCAGYSLRPSFGLSRGFGPGGEGLLAAHHR